MTTGKRTRRRRKPDVLPKLILLLALLLAYVFGYAVATVTQAKEWDPVEPPEVTTQSPATTATAGPVDKQPEPEAIRTRDDIVSEGNALSYELQEIMQDCCDKYGVPYALLLAIAETETRFDPDAVSRTNDYGLMQINKVNHAWLQEIGLDPLTPTGNIEAGTYIISQHLQNYGEPELALMAYNCGPSGAKKLWDAGVYQTDYSRKVMTAFERWTGVLEE